MSDFKKVLVTGGAGFIGSHLVERLAKSDYEVTVLDNLSTGKLSNIDDSLQTHRASFIEGDVTDSEIADQCLKKIDAVIHLAAIASVPYSLKNPVLTYKTNADGTLDLLNSSADANVKKFIFVSTCAVYGEPHFLPVTENHPTHPISPYAISKLQAEHHCVNFQQKNGLKTVILRLFNVYGPRQGLNEYSGVITQFMNRVKNDLPIIIYGDGNQTRDFVHVWDVADAVFDALKCRSAAGEVFNIGFGKATTVNDLATSALDLYGSDVDIIHEKPKTGEIRDSYADISKAKKILGYAPKVSLESGLRSLVEDD